MSKAMNNSDDRPRLIPSCIAIPTLFIIACIIISGVIYLIVSSEEIDEIYDKIQESIEEKPLLVTPIPSESTSVTVSAAIVDGCGEVNFYWGPDSRIFRPVEATVCKGRNFHAGGEVPYEVKTVTIAVDCWGTYCNCLIQIDGKSFGVEGDDNHAICTWDK